LRNFAFALLATTALGFTSSAFAADLIIDTPAGPGVVDVSSTWSGPYVGVFVGYQSGELTSPSPFVNGIEISGYSIGVVAGADFAIADGIVAGVAADLAWNDVGALSYTSGWNGSLRGRLGFDGGVFLPYVTAGLAFAGGEFGGIKNTHFGWTAGAGVEIALADKLSLDLQYRYTSYGEEMYMVDAGAFTHAVTAGLNLRF
jgi:outer membrane immunogenic protein